MELNRMESFLDDKLTLLEFTEKKGEDERSAFRDRFRKGEFSKQERAEILQRIHQTQSILWREMALLRNQREEVMDYMQSYGGESLEEAYNTTMSKGLIGYVHDFTTTTHHRLDYHARKIQKRHAKLSQEIFKTSVENYYCPPGRVYRDFYNWCPVTRGFVESDFHLAAARIIPREISRKAVLGALRQKNVLEDGTEILQNPENAMMMFRDVAKAFAQGRCVIVPFTDDDGVEEVSSVVIAEVALRERNLAHMRREESHINSAHLRSIHSDNMEAYRVSSAAKVAEARRQAAVPSSSSTKPRAPRYKAVVLDQTLIDNLNPEDSLTSSLRSNSSSSSEAGGGRTCWSAIHNSELIFPPGTRWPAARNFFFHFIITILRREFNGQNDQYTLEAIKGAWTSGRYFRLSVLRHLVRLVGVSNQLQEHALDWENVCFDEDVTLPEIDDADLAAKELASSLLAQICRLPGVEDQEVEEGYYSDFSDYE